jgi:hypothetical protein
MNKTELKSFLFAAREKKQWKEHCRKFTSQEEYDEYEKQKESEQDWKLKRPNNNNTWWY